MSPDILISLGDPAGIGGEVCAKALSLLPKNAQGRFLVIGNAPLWENLQQQFSLAVSFEASDNGTIPLGQESPSSGISALAALDKSISHLKIGSFKGLVTAPVSKKAIISSGEKDFLGHTGYLSKAFNTPVEMVFYSHLWSVLLATVHVPLKDVSKLLTKVRLKEAILRAVDFHKKFYAGRGTIALCGLNPHAGEGGSMGSEEAELFQPLIEELAKKGVSIAGPFAGDTIFREAEAGRFNMLISPYHDQALAAFKILHFQDGVNVSFGLPFLRCSPDHGCAFSIAEKNNADPTPMRYALEFALRNCE